MNGNKRRHLRVGASFPVEVARPDGANVRSTGTNISRSGLEIFCEGPAGAALALAAGDGGDPGPSALQLTMSLPFMTRSPARLAVAANVVRVSGSAAEGYRLGLHFGDLSPHASESIEAYVLEKMRFEGG